MTSKMYTLADRAAAALDAADWESSPEIDAYTSGHSEKVALYATWW